MAFSVNAQSCAMLNFNLNLKKKIRQTHLSPLPRCKIGEVMGFNVRNRDRTSFEVRASCFFNPTDQPILKEALKEPVAFLGGMFAGILRLDLEEEPLKEWVVRTAEASGITVEDINGEGSKPEEIPEQIEIE